ncbi:hypothetical protein [Chryseobacterium sp. MDT2-18]|uniref:hypothetical protein n=1 Tax=Chryseobacterium sp. MDT2-18 TaxID=1259136 RepID=UPI0027818CAE|nr:hypothetical protein [Chryseobacterium sp. MDT2-18]MDQ0476352.1 hypothetical protein [Chryseobacterium sp. MDT2-18]
MNILTIALLFLSAACLNVIMFYIFKKYLMKTENPAMLFLMINIFKDIIWVGYWLINLETDQTNFLVLIGIFLVTSFALYFKVIRLLNRS